MQQAATTHGAKFLAFQDSRIDGGEIIRPQTVYTDLVEVPTCGFWTVTWAAEHPQRGWETGVMLASRDPRHPYSDGTHVKNVVAEVLWGRGYVGDYRVVPVW